MTEIIEFPRHKIVREVPINSEIIEQAREKGLVNFADAVADDILDNLMRDLENYGVEVEGPVFYKDMSLTADALRATIYRAFGIEHHLHDFIDNSIKVKRKNADGEVEDITDELNEDIAEGEAVAEV